MPDRRYVVQAGDSLSGIAQSQLGNAILWPRIFVHNTRPEVVSKTHYRLASPDSLRAGEVLLIPEPDRVCPFGRSGSHPAQATRPKPIRSTQPASEVPSKAPSHPQSAIATPSAASKINSFPFKYTLDRVPPIKLESAVADIEVSFEGSLTIWADEQIPVLTYTNKGAELAAKQEADHALSTLLSDTQVTWDRKTNKVEFEDMLTVHAAGLPPSLSSVGFAVDSKSLTPVLRARFKTPEVKGRYMKFLYVSPEVTITVDIRPKPQDPEITRQAEPATQPAWYEGPLHFAEKYGLYVAAGVTVVVVIGSNVVTLGADTPADIPAGLAVGGMLATAGAM